MYYVYIIRCKYNKLYIGVSSEPQVRLKDHQLGLGAQFTKKYPPIKIVYTEKFNTLKEARKREIQIKKWSRIKKEALINGTIGQKIKNDLKKNTKIN